MGASGSAWIKPKKRSGMRTEMLADVPHPRFVRPGQRYFPLTTSGASRVTLHVVRLLPDGSRCEAKREDASGTRVKLSIARLLAPAPEGPGGRHYRFVGYAGARSYRTHALVLRIEGPWAHVVVPEWHPGVPIAVAAGDIPADQRRPGIWLACAAALGADAPARVGPTRFKPTEPGFAADRYSDVRISAGPADRSVAASRPASGPGCGDVVLCGGEPALQEALGERGVYVIGHPPPLEQGGRLYLQVGGEVRGWRTVRGVRPLPNGSRVELEGPWHEASVDRRVRLPAAGVANGEHGRQLWVWRSWPREAEDDLVTIAR